eukprot:scaffold1355_cov268-Pinguiococcus_pyrenoidosus.AAC.6
MKPALRSAPHAQFGRPFDPFLVYVGCGLDTTSASPWHPYAPGAAALRGAGVVLGLSPQHSQIHGSDRAPPNIDENTSKKTSKK